MKTKWRIVSCTLAMALGIHAELLFCQNEAAETKAYKLNDALVAIAATNHMAVIGEVVKPMPTVYLAEDMLQNKEGVVIALRKQLPQYDIEADKRILLVAERNLRRDSNNPLNARLKWFKMPEDLDRLKIHLPGAVASARLPGDGVGGIDNGLGVPSELSPKLKPEELHNITVREILIRAGQEAGTMISILSLPTAHPKAEADTGNEFLDWELAGGKGLENYKNGLSRGQRPHQ